MTLLTPVSYTHLDVYKRQGLARVSSTPGKTQTINFYELEAKRVIEGEDERASFYLVDLPGYGFAKTNHNNKDQWSGFISKYLSGSENLGVVCQLIDIRHKPMDSDMECFNWLRSCGLKVQVVLTKSDKLSKNAAMSQKALFKREMGLKEHEIITYSLSLIHILLWSLFCSFFYLFLVRMLTLSVINKIFKFLEAAIYFFHVLGKQLFIICYRIRQLIMVQVNHAFGIIVGGNTYTICLLYTS